MDNDAVDAVKYIIATNLGVKADTIRLENDLIDDLGADSIGLVCITLGLEAFFDITISEEEAENILTVKDAVQHVVQKKEA